MTTPNGRRSPSRRTTPKTAKVSLDLDKLDAEGSDREPFTARIAGKVFTFNDPGDMDYFEMTDLARGGPAGETRMLHKMLGGSADEFIATRPTTRQVMQLFIAWRDHYGMLDPGEALASVTTSNGTDER